MELTLLPYALSTSSMPSVKIFVTIHFPLGTGWHKHFFVLWCAVVYQLLQAAQ